MYFLGITIEALLYCLEIIKSQLTMDRKLALNNYLCTKSSQFDHIIMQW